MTLAFHGGEGAYWPFRPGQMPNIGTDITEGIMVTPVDDMVINIRNEQRHVTSRWFGWADTADPFSPFVGNPPQGSIINNYTQKLLIWLINYLQRPSNGLSIDANRISMFGHSEGGRGVDMFCRYRPGVISAGYTFCAADSLEGDGPSRLFGEITTGLETNIFMNGNRVKFYDALDWNTPLNGQTRDWPFMKIYSGKNEVFEGGYTSWNSHKVQLYRDRDALGMGSHLFWDRRDHGVNEWNTENPSNAWVDVGEWITQIPLARTKLATVSSLQKYRLNQSFPAFFQCNLDPNTFGQQPDPGNGDRFNGDDWGTLGGFADWDRGTMTDTARAWSCTAWLNAGSSTPVDNCPSSTMRCSLTIRRPQNFKPTPDMVVFYRVRDVATGLVLHIGTLVPSPAGLVTLPTVELARFPNKRRIEVIALGHLPRQ